MKIASYHKSIGNNVCLIFDYKDLYVDENMWLKYKNAITKYITKQTRKNNDVLASTMIPCFKTENIKYDRIFISKVFTDTKIDDNFLQLDIVEYGGTGFYYDTAPPLAPSIEHIMPDYNLYDIWIEQKLSEGVKPKELTYYTDYSIGFLTRGCFRGCTFCVNKNYKKCSKHSSVYEFMDLSRPKLCFLDDNFFACTDWKNIIEEVKSTGKKFQFKQGLDERLLSDDKIHEIMFWNYDGDYIFAFDNIEDRPVIENKLSRIFELYPNFKKRLKFYVLCGYDRNERWDEDFWEKDIRDTFDRIFVLAKYSALPYIMRYEKCYSSPHAGTYSNIASWCNQPSIFKKFSFRMFSICRGMGNEGYKKYKRDFVKYLNDGGVKYSSWRYMDELASKYPDIADKYFDITPDAILEYGNGRRLHRRSF